MTYTGSNFELDVNFQFEDSENVVVSDLSSYNPVLCKYFFIKKEWTFSLISLKAV